MSTLSFWDRSWQAIDAKRISSYFEQLDRSRDEIICFLLSRDYKTVCDAGCGCGVYALKLASFGFMVSGFDISADAVALSQSLLAQHGVPFDRFRTADVCATAYTDGQFDAVVARDTLDHMPFRQAVAALGELLRIVRPGGSVLLTLDGTDNEYEREAHTVNGDGDYLFCGGKWDGMVFHPYSPPEIARLTAGRKAKLLSASSGSYLVAVGKEQKEA